MWFWIGYATGVLSAAVGVGVAFVQARLTA